MAKTTPADVNKVPISALSESTIFATKSQLCAMYVISYLFLFGLRLSQRPGKGHGRLAEDTHGQFTVWL